MVPVIAMVFTAACAVSTAKPDGAANVREKLTLLQADSQLSSRAQVAIKDAETATRIAEQPEKDSVLAAHRVYMADRKVEIAMAIAESRLLEDQREDLLAERESARLDSRTREADSAHRKAKTANEESAQAKQRNAELQQQLAELNAKQSKRGMILTIGDILFETGKSELKSGAISNLDKLAKFLNENQERKLIIEGFTDNTGSDEYNLALSQRRAESVQVYLLKKGIASDRMEVTGKGETNPVTSNDSAAGRQHNRRVEVILPDSAS